MCEGPLPHLGGDFDEQIRVLVAYIENEINNELCVLEALKVLVLQQQQPLASKHVSRPKSRLSDADHNIASSISEILTSLCTAIEQNKISEDVCAFGMRAAAPMIKRCKYKLALLLLKLHSALTITLIVKC